MSSTEHDMQLDEVNEAAARVEFDRLLGDHRFRATERNRAILKYLSDLHFSGESDGAKAYSIAIDVLGRSSDFEPSLDPIVRIELSRLRSALEAYYSAFGHESAVWLIIPRGRYVVRFVSAEQQKSDCESGSRSEEEAEFGAGDCDGESLISEARRPPGWQNFAAAASCFCFLAVAVAAVWYLTEGSVGLAQPTVTITVTPVGESSDIHSSALRDNLQVALVRFDTLTIGYGGEGRQLPADYSIDIRFTETPNLRRAQWLIIDNHDRSLLDAGVEEVNVESMPHEAADRQLATLLAVRIADRDGAIGKAEIERAPAASRGNACVLRAYKAVRTQNAPEIESAFDCLQRTVLAEPKNATATAFLSKIVAAKGDKQSKQLAATLAEQAVAYDPRSDVAQLALAKSHFANGRLDAAIGSARLALADNPNSADAAATLAFYLFSRGAWDEATEMADTALSFKNIVPTEAILVKALDAFRNKDWASAARIANEISPRDSLARVVRAAALGRLGPTAESSMEIIELRTRYPNLSRESEELIRSQLFRPQFAFSLKTGLALASANYSAAATTDLEPDL